MFSQTESYGYSRKFDHPNSHGFTVWFEQSSFRCTYEQDYTPSSSHTYTCKNIHFPLREINRDRRRESLLSVPGWKRREIRYPPPTSLAPRVSIQKHHVDIRVSYDERIMDVLCANIFFPISVRANRRCNYAFQLMKQSPPHPCYLVVSVNRQTA